VRGLGADPLALEGPRLRAVPATAAHAGELQACLEAAPGYFLETEGALPDGDAAHRLLAEAEADPQRRLFLLAPRSGGAALGLLDLQLEYPEPDTAHIVLLLLRESCQGQGYGRETTAALEAALGTLGVRALRLAVVDENASAHAFWERLGFAAVGRLDRGVTVYERPLAPR
jgi:RimJ/RimL family protein N-acetyltransferase